MLCQMPPKKIFSLKNTRKHFIEVRTELANWRWEIAPG
jgi:hypothetical protein